MSSRFDKRKASLCVLLALLAAVLACGAWAQGKITEDPNVPGKSAVSEELPSKDERVAQKVTYEARKKRVVEILDDLSEMSGVTLKAGASNQDWQVRDRRMNIFAKNLPLAQLMNSIARVMKFKWSKSDDEAPTYRLFMDRKTLLGAEAQRLREEQRFQERQAEKRERMIRDFITLESLTPEQIVQLKADNPYLYLAATSGLAGSFGTFFRETPAAAEALVSGQPASISGASLTPAAQQALVQAVQQIRELQSAIAGPERPPSAGIEDNFDTVSIRLNQMLEHAQEMMPATGFLLGDLEVSYAGGDFQLPFFDPESSQAKVFGRAVIRSQEEGRPLEEVGKELESEAMPAMISEMKKEAPGEPTPERPDDPDLAKKIKLEKSESKLEDALAQLAKASGFAVVSDSFVQFPGIRGGSSPSGEIELRQALDRVGEAFGSNWEKRASVIEFRDKRWFRKRAAEIPESWLEGWRQTLKKTGTLEIGDLAQIAMLTQEQLYANAMEDDILKRGGVAWLVVGARDTLRLYAVLNEAQRAMLFSKGGLNLRSLSPDQWPAVERYVSSANPEFLQSPDARIAMFGTREQMGGRKILRYAFRITTSDNLPEIGRSIITPEYRPPESEQKKPEEAQTGEGK